MMSNMKKGKILEHLELIQYDFEYANHYLDYSMRHIDYLRKSSELNEEEKKGLLRVYINISNIIKNLNKLKNVEEVSNIIDKYEEQKR